jgi:hypothetical protein
MAEEEKTAESVRTVAKPAKKPTAKRTQRAAIPAREVPRKMSPKSVRGKIALYQKTATEFQSAARKMLQSGATTLQSGVRVMQTAIGEQVKENLEAAAAMQSGVNQMWSAIEVLYSTFMDHMKATQAYVKDFYG